MEGTEREGTFELGVVPPSRRDGGEIQRGLNKKTRPPQSAGARNGRWRWSSASSGENRWIPSRGSWESRYTVWRNGGTRPSVAWRRPWCAGRETPCKWSWARPCARSASSPWRTNCSGDAARPRILYDPGGRGDEQEGISHHREALPSKEGLPGLGHTAVLLLRQRMPQDLLRKR